ncbi:MAG: protease modulator HflC [Hyphomicrobiaceae bacterium]|nr:protease modulator HflC [Hyphomicrobiaceae bacterium]
MMAILVALGIAAVGTYLSMFIVHQNQQALVLEFGKPKRIIDDAGLHWKLPVVETVEYFDKRILDLDTSPQELFSSDQNKLIVDSFARYRIVDALRFYQTVRNEAGVRSRVGPILDSSLRRVLGSATLADAVRDRREGLMNLIQQQVNTESRDFGIEIVDVRIKRADLPPQNSASIYERMKTDRHREAAEFRAQGEEQSRRIRAEADRAVTVMRAEADRDARRMRGEGDAERARISNEAFGQDPEFYQFLRSMEAYETALRRGDTRLVISPSSATFRDFFRYFSESVTSPGKAPAVPTGTMTPSIALPKQ